MDPEFCDLPTVRTAVVAQRNGVPSLETVQRYLPRNYTAVVNVEGEISVVGHDVAGWTLDDYVIPRLASGLIFAEEVK